MSLVTNLIRRYRICFKIDILHIPMCSMLAGPLYKSKVFNQVPESFTRISRKMELSNLFVRNYCTVRENTDKMVAKEGLLRILLYYGFNDDNATNLINDCPDITKLSENELMENLHCLTQCQFGEKQLVSLLIKHPNLIFINSKHIENVYLFLLPTFTKKEIHKIFLNSPHILLDKVDTIQEKLSFLQIEMVVPKSQIINSSALGYTLHHVKERHEFLKRVGVYKTPDKKHLVQHVNPKLDIIVSSPNEDFATKVAGVSLLEYEVFQQLFLNEERDYDDND